MEKGLLLIDDSSDHTGVLANISSHLRTNEHVDVSGFYLNPVDREFWDEKRDPDINAVIAGAKRRLATFSVGLIIVDQYYSDAPFDGISLIQRLREIPKFKICPIFLISGKRDKIVRDIFSAAGKSDNDKVNELSKIIGLGISRFLDKAFRDEAIEVLKRKDLNDILPAKLREYEQQDVRINKFSPKYAQLPLPDLADHIESNSAEAAAILEEMFELTLTHYANINAGLQ